MVVCKSILRVSTVLILLAVTSPLNSAERAGITWHRDINVAWRSTKAKGRPMLVFITMDGCGYCVKMKRTTFRDAGVAEDIRGSFEPVVLDGERRSDLVAKLGVQAYPTTILISSDAKILDFISGYVSPKRLSHRLRVAASRVQSGDAPATETAAEDD